MSERGSSSEISQSGDLEKLLAHDDLCEEYETSYSSSPPKLPSRRTHMYLCVSLLANAILITTIFYLLRHPIEIDKSQVLYTPAKDAIEYTSITYTSGYLDDKSRWQSHGEVPTDEQDEAWSKLYEGLIYSRIPRHQAAQLTNLTVPIPDDEGMYVAGLDVFHQLHCLDNLRKSQWPQRYSPHEHMGGQNMSLLSAKHLDHCIDQIRQSLMCASDASTGWLEWNEEHQMNLAVMSTTHSCRRFERIQEWARERKLITWDAKVRMEDPLKRDVNREKI